MIFTRFCKAATRTCKHNTVINTQTNSGQTSSQGHHRVTCWWWCNSLWCRDTAWLHTPPAWWSVSPSETHVSKRSTLKTSECVYSLILCFNFTLEKKSLSRQIWRQGVVCTSLSKLALVNSRELSRALVAASLTLLLGSSFLMPWMMAVRIWLAFSCSCSGSWRNHNQVNNQLILYLLPALLSAAVCDHSRCPGRCIRWPPAWTPSCVRCSRGQWRWRPAVGSARATG